MNLIQSKTLLLVVLAINFACYQAMSLDEANILRKFEESMTLLLKGEDHLRETRKSRYFTANQIMMNVFTPKPRLKTEPSTELVDFKKFEHSLKDFLKLHFPKTGRNFFIG